MARSPRPSLRSEREWPGHHAHRCALSVPPMKNPDWPRSVRHNPFNSFDRTGAACGRSHKWGIAAPVFGITYDSEEPAEYPVSPGGCSSVRAHTRTGIGSTKRVVVHCLCCSPEYGSGFRDRGLPGGARCRRRGVSIGRFKRPRCGTIDTPRDVWPDARRNCRGSHSFRLAGTWRNRRGE